MNTPSFVTELFPDLPEFFPLDALSDLMQGMVAGLSRKFSISPEVAFAICATALAAHMGPAFPVESWNARTTPSWYFVLIGDVNPQLDAAIKLAWGPILLDARAVSEAFMAQNLPKPTISVRDTTLARLTSAARDCFDKSLLLPPGQDDAAHWLALSRTDRRALAQTLAKAWQGEPTADSLLHLNLLWRCNPGNSHRFGNCNHIRENNVPFWFLLSGPPSPLTEITLAPLESQSKWARTLDVLFQHRVYSRKQQIQQFTPEGAKRLIRFVNEFNQRLECFPAEFHPFLRWLPEAVVQFSNMDAFLGDVKGAVTENAVDNAIKVINWMGAAHLRAIIAAIYTSHVEDKQRKCQTSPEEHMLDKVRLKQPVLWSTLRRSYPDSKAEPLVAIRDRLVAEGRLKWIGSKLELGEPAPTGS